MAAIEQQAPCITSFSLTGETDMIATTLTYLILAASGLIGSAIAWDDLRKGADKSVAK